MQTIQQQILASIHTWETKLRNNNIQTPNQQKIECPNPFDLRLAFHIKQVRWTAEQLLYVSNCIREYATTNNNLTVSSLLTRELLIGRAISRTLALFNLRKTITLPIETYYGINYARSKIYPEIKHRDGPTAYLVDNLDWDPDSVNIFKDGVSLTLTRTDYLEQYPAAT